MQHKLTQLKKMKEVSLTTEERAFLRGRMSQVMITPITATSPLLARGIQHGLRITLSSFLFVVFVGGSISAVASNALPGDPLYSFKVNVNEEVRGLFLNTTEEKVALHQSLVENRVKEIQTLAESKTLTKEKQKKAEKALDNNISNLSKELNTLSDQSPNTALTVTADLEESLKANKEAIKETLSVDTATSIEGDTAATAAIKTVDDTLKKVSQQEIKILSKEIDNITSEAAKTPTTASANSDASITIDPTTETTPPDTATTTSPPSTPVGP